MYNQIQKMISSLGFWEAVAKGCNWLLLASLPLFITESNYGTVALLASYLLLISNVGVIGQNKVILRFVKVNNTVYLPHNILISSLATIGIFALVVSLLDIEKSVWLQLVVATVLFSNYTLYIAYARKVFDHVHYAKIRIAYALTRLIAGLVLLILFGDPVYYLYAEIIAILMGLLIVKKGRAFYHFKGATFSDGAFSKSLKFGAPLIIHSFSTYALSYIDRIVMAVYLTTDEVGRYVALYTYAASLSFIYAILTVTKEPQIYDAEDRIAAEKVASDYLRLCLLYGSLAALVVFGFYYLIFIHIKGVEVEALWAFGLVTGAHLIIPFYLKKVYLLTRTEKTGLISTASLIAAFANIVLNIWLIPIYGIIGAAMTTVFSYVVLFLLTSGFYRLTFR